MGILQNSSSHVSYSGNPTLVDLQEKGQLIIPEALCNQTEPATGRRSEAIPKGID